MAVVLCAHGMRELNHRSSALSERGQRAVTNDDGKTPPRFTLEETVHHESLTIPEYPPPPPPPLQFSLPGPRS